MDCTEGAGVFDSGRDREEAVGFWDRPGKVGSRPGGLRLLGREAQVGGERLQKGKIQKKFHLP